MSTTILLPAQIKHKVHDSGVRGGGGGATFSHTERGSKQMAAMDWLERNGTLIHPLHLPVDSRFDKTLS